MTIKDEQGLSHQKLRALIEGRSSPWPRELDLSFKGVDSTIVQLLIEAPWFTGVVKLRLSGCFLGSDGVRLLASGMPSELECLDLAGVAQISGPTQTKLRIVPDGSYGALDDDSILHLVKALGPNLRELSLVRDGISDAALGILASASWAASLRRLNLVGNSFSTASLMTLQDSPNLAAQLELVLDRPRDPMAEAMLVERFPNVRFYDYPRTPRELSRRR